MWIFKRKSSENNLLKKKKTKLLTEGQEELNKKSKEFCICEGKFQNKYFNDKKCRKFGDNCHYTGEYRDVVHSLCNLKYNMPKIIDILFRNQSNYDNYFIIKKLTE